MPGLMRPSAAVLGGLAVVAAACARPAPPPGSPLVPGAGRGLNVLLVTIDTLRQDRVGAYGRHAGLTPTLDALAARGVRFVHAFSHVPLTLPAHTSILTGRTPVHHGVHLNGSARLDDAVPTLATTLKTAGYRTGAFVGAFVLDARYGLTRGFDRYDAHYATDGGNGSFAFAERPGAEVVQAAGDWILEPGAAVPWLAWVHLFDPHAPYAAPAEYRAGRTPYDAEVAYADAMVGRLLDRLGPAVLERTLVVVTADHGESLGDHGETTHGLFAYDATIAVPLILAGAGITPGLVEAPVGHDDILPTVADLLGVAAPDGMDGQSAARPLAADRAVYIEALDAALTRNWAPLTGVATSAWKYIHLPTAELYDRGADAAEARNLATDQPARVSALERTRLRLTAAPADPAPAAARGAADERRLRALGYVAAPAQAGAGAAGAFTEADDPKHLVALNERFNDALTSYTEGHAADALAAFLGVLAERPDFTTARTSAATVLVATGRAAEAARLLRAAPPPLDAAPGIQAKLGEALRAAGDLQGAAAALERARAGGDADPDLLNDLGGVYAGLGRLAEARAAFTALLALDADAAEVWHNLGVLELSARRPDAAAAAFRHAVDVEPSRADAWEGLGAALVERDRAGAVEAWRRAERLAPGNFDLLFNLGMVLADGPTPAEARPYLTRFLREAPRAQYARDLPVVEARLRALGRR
ncbi:MAG: sulfatase-like hydrolase/transferase [Vicinamibacterales bacterium]